jgi:hypothetical protein
MNSRTRLRFLLSIVALVLPLLVSPATAQYMYLDSNGDGIHTAADQVNPAGPTTIDVWLDTAANRDGSPTTCEVDPSLPLTINAYVVALRANNGTVSWGVFTNRQPTMNVFFGLHSTDTEFVSGYGGLAPFPPGRYFLATLILNVLSGTPAVDIVPSVPVYQFEQTSFGTGAGGCYGNDFDNTLKLGGEWHDADGLPYGTGGSPNQPPLLQQPNAMTATTGELAFQMLTATDADHQPLTFSKMSGPAFMTVTTTDIGTGTATGGVALAPLASNAGAATGTVAVTDGFATDQRTFSIDVTAGPNHIPSLAGPASITAVIGTTPRFTLGSFDPDGQALTFQKSEAPDYVQVQTLASGPGGAVGSLNLSPGLCDAGTATATVAVTDGIVSDSRTIEIRVITRRAAPAQPPAASARIAVAVAVGDLNADGHEDIFAGGLDGYLSSILGNGDGTFAPPGILTLQGSEITSVTLGDWDSDGQVDGAATVLSPDRLVILRGNGAGGFTAGAVYQVGSVPAKVLPGDLDRDGDLDLVVSNSGGIAILLANGDGTFNTGSLYPMGNVSYGLALADFNGDGRLDVATANINSKDIGIRLGLGNGTFGDPSHLSFGIVAPHDVVSRDWDHDGAMDLAATLADGTIRIFAGDGHGAFTPTGNLPAPGFQQSMNTTDLDGDGNQDLLVTNLPVAGVLTQQLFYGHGNGTFSVGRVITPGASGGVTSGDFNEDGFPDVASAEGNILIWLNDAGGAGMPEARAFPESNSPAGGKPAMCMRLEPVSGSYQNVDIDPTSITLSPESGTGSVSAITTKSATIRDTDGNGIAEVPACFPRDGIAALFDTQNGRQTVNAHVQGALTDGRVFCAKVSFDIIGTSKKLAASVSPNPLNPGGILRLTTSRNGFVRVRMFDLQGRVVRVLEDRAMVPAGAHDVRIDGRNTAGQTLASGVYFYQVETVEGSLKGRITVLK